MNTFEIIENTDPIMIINKTLDRKYIPNVEIQVTKRGFTKLNIKEILTHKLKAYDFTHTYINNVQNDLILFFKINNGLKDHEISISCKEIFEYITPVYIEDMNNDELKKIIFSLKRQVDILTEQYEECEEKLESFTRSNSF
jgi:hypothetical protein